MPFHLVLRGALAVVLAGAAHQAAVALRVVELGTAPGEGPPGEWLVAAAIVAMPVAGVVGAVWQFVDRADERRARLLAAVDVAAAAFVVCRFLAFDPYYLPTLRRFSEGGNVGATWIVLVAALLVAAAVATVKRPAAGPALSAPPLVIAAVTAVLTGVGH